MEPIIEKYSQVAGSCKVALSPSQKIWFLKAPASNNQGVIKKTQIWFVTSLPADAAVSKAFSCLSDANKRAAYDRYGEDQPGISRAGRGSPFGGPQGFDDFDPNEIFNMFFGGFPGGRSAGLILVTSA